jgi:metal-sulfur cluster biosynthetic enzyme
MGGMIAGQAKQKILDNIDGVEEATVDLVWDPPWEPSMMSEEAKHKLGVG